MTQLAVEGSEAHCASHHCDVLLFFHYVDDIVVGLLVHFTAVGIGITQHVAGKLDYHHLHAKANAKGRDVVGAGVFDGGYLALNASLSESGADDHAVKSGKLLLDIAFVEHFRVDKLEHRLVVVVRTGLRQAFTYALVGILKVVFSYEATSSVAFLRRSRKLRHGPSPGVSPIGMFSFRNMAVSRPWLCMFTGTS